MAITRRVSVRQTRQLQARGSVLRATVNDAASPIAYGYDGALAVYFNQAPVFNVADDVSSPFIPDRLKDAYWENEVPRVVISFAERDVLMSGMLRGEREIAGTPAVIDAPVGAGHVILFANRPFRRWQTRGSHALVFNAMLHWNDLRAGWPSRPAEAAEAAVTDGGQDG
jgi:hypothetical protein